MDALRGCTVPVLLSRGSESPALFGAVLDRVGEALSGARTHVFAGAGHMPHVSHPDDFTGAVTSFFADPTGS